MIHKHITVKVIGELHEAIIIPRHMKPFFHNYFTAEKPSVRVYNAPVSKYESSQALQIASRRLHLSTFKYEYYQPNEKSPCSFQVA
jgi:hypothetical protein